MQESLEWREIQAGQDCLVTVADLVRLVTLAGQAVVAYQELMDDQVVQVHLEVMVFQEVQVINNNILIYYICMHTLCFFVDLVENLYF